jgi:hypothetical protein
MTLNEPGFSLPRDPMCLTYQFSFHYNCFFDVIIISFYWQPFQ